VFFVLQYFPFHILPECCDTFTNSKDFQLDESSSSARAVVTGSLKTKEKKCKILYLSKSMNFIEEKPGQLN
jgi:hypothetical protein